MLSVLPIPSYFLLATGSETPNGVSQGKILFKRAENSWRWIKALSLRYNWSLNIGFWPPSCRHVSEQKAPTLEVLVWKCQQLSIQCAKVLCHQAKPFVARPCWYRLPGKATRPAPPSRASGKGPSIVTWEQGIENRIETANTHKWRHMMACLFLFCGGLSP